MPDDPSRASLSAPHTDDAPAPIHDVEGAFGVLTRLRQRLRAVVRGRDDAIDLITIALLADGHVLLEDFPGSGKTTLAKALGDSIVDEAPDTSERGGIAAFRRIQFTPDLLPSDITGTTVFEPAAGRFSFRPGPIFAHVVLADEINRTSPKVQAALLEAMAEKQVTIDNATRPLDELFFVIATQNPLDLAGTFPLPAAQLDRFLFKIRMTHIDRASELEVLAGYKARLAGRPHTSPDLPRVTRREILGARAFAAANVHVAREVQECLVDLAEETRKSPHVAQGASTRALVLMIPALQVRALGQRRDFASADDVEALARFVFAHRIDLAPGIEDADAVVRACMQRPLERLARASMRSPKTGARSSPARGEDEARSRP
jgi:MoxR-like ATPase